MINCGAGDRRQAPAQCADKAGRIQPRDDGSIVHSGSTEALYPSMIIALQDIPTHRPIGSLDAKVIVLNGNHSCVGIRRTQPKSDTFYTDSQDIAHLDHRRYVAVHPNRNYFIDTCNDDVAEGQLWSTTVEGCRIPVSAMQAEQYGARSFATDCVEYPPRHRIKSVDE